MTRWLDGRFVGLALVALVALPASCGSRSALELPSGPLEASAGASDAPFQEDAGAVDSGPDASDGSTGIDAPTCPPATDLTASQGTRDDAVQLSWTPPDQASSLELTRDGVVIATLSVFDTTYVDFDAAGAPESSPPTGLEASQGTRTDGVWLTWTPAVVTGSPAHAYAVVAVCAAGERVSTPEVSGYVGGPAVSYELSRDDGVSWAPIETTSSYLDTLAPFGTLATQTPVATPYFQLSSVALRTQAVAAGQGVTYRVRAVTSSGVVGETNSAPGSRGIGSLSYQWQRSAGTTATAYSDLTDVTGSSWFDDTAPEGQMRFYRVVVSAEGAKPATSEGVSVQVPFHALMIDGGGSHTCGLATDLRIRCWGKNDSGQSSAPTQSFKAVSAGSDQSCGIGLDDKVVCWGSAAYPPNDTFKAIAVGGLHVCGIRTDDHVVCWGSNNVGQAPSTPSADAFKAISAGYYHTCGIRMDGTLSCWGFTDQTAAPAGTFKAVSAGEQHTCAIRDDDKVLCWGNNQYGEMVRGPSTVSYKAIASGQGLTCGIRTDDKLVCWGTLAMTSSDSFKAVTAGDFHVCGIRTNDTITCWGRNDVGQAPSQPATDHYTAVATGNHTCAIRTDGSLACWGGTYDNDRPVQVSMASFASLTVGGAHTCAIRNDDKVLCWGDNNLGEAPPGPSTDSFRRVTATDDFTCGIRMDDKLVCWGNRHQGQIPAGPSTANYADASGGYGHLCAVRSDGALTCWGDNTYGQAPPGPTSDSFLSVAASFFNTCALRSDDKAVCWGTYDYNTTPVPPSDSFLALAAGSRHGCGIRLDGHIVCWGQNDLGQVLAAPSTDTYVAIDADAFTTCGVRSDGRVICWGDDTGGTARSLLVVP